MGSVKKARISACRHIRDNFKQIQFFQNGLGNEFSLGNDKLQKVKVNIRKC